MYITKNIKQKDLPEGKYILKCDNYCDKNTYWLVDKKLYKQTVLNFTYDKANNKINIKQLKKSALYKAVEIDKKYYSLYNL